MSDVWAQASQNTHQNSTTAASTQNGNDGVVQAGPISNMDDPFLRRSEVPQSGGSGVTWDPRVPMEDLADRMVVIVPKTLNPNATDPFNKGKTREEWRADVVILDGEPFEFTYNARATDAQGNFIEKPGGGFEMTEKTFSVAEFPAKFRSQSIAQGQLVKALKSVADAGGLYFGVMRRVPFVADARKGKTIETVAQELATWRQQIMAGKTLEKPNYTWNLDDRPEVLTQERMNLAAAWWETEKAARLAEGN